MPREFPEMIPGRPSGHATVNRHPGHNFLSAQVRDQNSLSLQSIKNIRERKSSSLMESLRAASVHWKSMGKSRRGAKSISQFFLRDDDHSTREVHIGPAAKIRCSRTSNLLPKVRVHVSRSHSISFSWTRKKFEANSIEVRAEIRQFDFMFVFRSFSSSVSDTRHQNRIGCHITWQIPARHGTWQQWSMLRHGRRNLTKSQLAILQKFGKFEICLS